MKHRRFSKNTELRNASGDNQNPSARLFREPDKMCTKGNESSINEQLCLDTELQAILRKVKTSLRHKGSITIVTAENGKYRFSGRVTERLFICDQALIFDDNVGAIKINLKDIEEIVLE